MSAIRRILNAAAPAVPAPPRCQLQNLGVRAVVVRRRRREIRELVGETGGVAAVAAEAEALEPGVGEPELGCELRLVEQPDLLRRRPRDRLRRLDLEPPVAPQAGRRRDQLADDHVLLQADEAIGLALERRVREHLGGLLERRRREERVRRERGLRDPEDDLLVLGGLALALL